MAGSVARTLGKLSGDRAHRKKVMQAGASSMRTTLRAFAKVTHILWLEITGLFFLLFAFIGAVEFVKRFRAHDTKQMAAAALIALVFGYFAATSFWRARKVGPEREQRKSKHK